MVFRKSLIISLLTLISRIFGYVREILMAMVLGAGPIANAFHIAFRFANVFRSFLAEGAFVASFVPVYSKHVAKKEFDAANIYASQTFVMITVVAIVITVIAELMMPKIIWFLAPGFQDNTVLMENAILLARINFPYLFFMCLSAFFGGILGVYNSFSAVALSPLLLNLMMIFALMIKPDNKFDTAQILSLFIVISGSMQLMLVWWQVRKLNLKIMFKWPRYDEDMQTFAKAFFPGVLSSSVTQINLWVSTALATFYDGLVSHLYYADRVLQLPLALIGASVSVVLLPVFSKMTVNEESKINSLMMQTIEFTMFLTLPIVSIVTFLNKDIISFMFEYGSFSSEDANKTGTLLMVMIFALPAYIFNKILTPRFFSVHDTKTPFIAALISMLVNLLINLAFLKFYRYFWSLSVATVISSWLNVVILSYSAVRNKLFALLTGNLSKIFKIVILSVFLGVVGYLLSPLEFVTIKQIDLPIKLLILMAIYLAFSIIFNVYKISDIYSIVKK